MPYCQVSGGENGIKIFYQTYGHGPIKVLMLIGLQARLEKWLPQIKGLTGTDVANDNDNDNDNNNGGDGGGVQVCGLDNRGTGRSTIPSEKSDYSTTLMARDAIALMDHLGWRKFHVVGHSMGGMIALKLAALVPDRVSSMAIINMGGGGYEMFPKACWLSISSIIRLLLSKAPEESTGVELDVHYSQSYLNERIGQRPRRSILYREYVEAIAKDGETIGDGFSGQFSACWRHEITDMEFEQIRSGRFLISVIHGGQDFVAPLYRAKRRAQKLFPFARMVQFHGSHLVIHERENEVNEELLKLIRAAESKMNPHEWTNLPDRTHSGTELTAAEQLLRFLIFLVGVLMITFEFGRGLVGRVKTVRAASYSKPRP